MLLAAKSNTRRSGATVVELTAVILIFLVLFFGIMEYCFILFTYNIVENAAREGTRYAVVNVTDATMISDTQTYVQSLMCGFDTKMTNYSCNVYLADSAGKNINTKTVNATTAQFGQYVCTDVSVDYVPMTPGLLFLTTFTIRSKCSMISEAN